jgi:hypothetical protein
MEDNIIKGMMVVEDQEGMYPEALPIISPTFVREKKEAGEK